MAVRKKKRTVVSQEITEEKRLEMIRELEKDLKELREAGTGTAYTMDDIRRAIEEARSALEEVGEFDMELEGDEYVIRLSQHVSGKIKYDPRTGKIFIILPDDTKWRQDWDGHWDRRSLGMHINIMVLLHESRQKIHWLEEEAKRLHRLSILSGDARQQEMASQLMAMAREIYDKQMMIEHLELRCMAAAAATGRMMDKHGDQLRRAKLEKKRAEDAKKKAQEREAEAAEAREKAQASLKTKQEEVKTVEGRLDAVQEENKKTIGKLTGTIKEQKDELKSTKARNSRLAQENNKIKNGRREQYKKPRAGKKGGNREAPRCMPATKWLMADQHSCHVCNTPLGGAAEPYTRTVEEMEMGRWEVIEYKVTRKWCLHCKRLRSTPVPGTMPNQRFGNRALGMFSFLKMLGVSFRKIELIFMVFYNVHISKKTIQEAVRRVNDALTPEYEAIHAHILEGKGVNGDETTWRVMGLLYWVWCIVGDDAVWFNIQKGRGKEEAMKMLEEFVGMVTSDSLPAWNHVGTEHQKCHLHYERDLKKTIQENKNPEFQAFARKLKQILWDSHTKEKGYDPDDDLQTRERKRRNLMRRLAYLMNKDYTDGDCKRYIKRLRREFYHLFSHVISGIDWHNNKAERAVRCFVLLRHVMFSNRTELDADTYAKLLSIIGTAVMRGVNPLEYMVEAMSQPHGSPVELPRPPTDGDNTWPSSDPPSGSGGAVPATN